MITDERRAFKRVPHNFLVKYKLYTARAKSGLGMAISKNISLGGVYFVSLEKFNVGDLIDCRIQLHPGDKEARWLARVVRCENIKEELVDSFGIAVEFVKSFDNSEFLLKFFLDTLNR